MNAPWWRSTRKQHSELWYLAALQGQQITRGAPLHVHSTATRGGCAMLWTAASLMRHACRASFDGRHTMRMLRDSSIRCTTSQCALPMINLGYLDRDWYGEQVHLPASISVHVPARVAAL